MVKSFRVASSLGRIFSLVKKSSPYALPAPGLCPARHPSDGRMSRCRVGGDDIIVMWG